MLILSHWSVDYEMESCQKFVYSELVEIPVQGRISLIINNVCKPVILWKVTLLHGYFSRFYKWYKIMQSITYSDKFKKNKKEIKSNGQVNKTNDINDLLPRKIYLFKVSNKNTRKKCQILTGCYYHVMHAFQSQSILHSCLNVKEFTRNPQPLSS